MPDEFLPEAETNDDSIPAAKPQRRPHIMECTGLFAGGSDLIRSLLPDKDEETHPRQFSGSSSNAEQDHADDEEFEKYATMTKVFRSAFGQQYLRIFTEVHVIFDEDLLKLCSRIDGLDNQKFTDAAKQSAKDVLHEFFRPSFHGPLYGPFPLKEPRVWNIDEQQR